MCIFHIQDKDPQLVLMALLDTLMGIYYLDIDLKSAYI